MASCSGIPRQVNLPTLPALESYIVTCEIVVKSLEQKENSRDVSLSRRGREELGFIMAGFGRHMWWLIREGKDPGNAVTG